MTTHVAIDLGATGGKIYIGEVENEIFTINDVWKFKNEPRLEKGRYVWDAGYIYENIRKGLKKIKDLKIKKKITSIGIDGWGVDFGLIDKNGKLLQNPYSYRDPLLRSTIEKITKKITREELFEITGINHWNIANTLWQYHYISQKEGDILKRADKILMIPQLFSFILGGDVCAEETLASTTQMMNIRSRDWAYDLLEALNLQSDKLPEIKRAGERIGFFKDSELALPASHDTASAVAGMPLGGNHRAFLSTGTWFIVGLELKSPCIKKEAFEMGASNEVGAGGTIEFLKNITGLFLLEECRNAWRKTGKTYDYDSLLKRASRADSFASLIDPDDPSFAINADMPGAVFSYCKKTGQKCPQNEGEVTRCIFESLAIKVALTLEKLMSVAGVKSRKLHLSGGGIYNDMLCQMISSATSMPIVAGPIESTAVGNVMTQATAYSEIGSISEGRSLIEKRMEFKEFVPEKDERWNEAKDKMRDFFLRL